MNKQLSITVLSLILSFTLLGQNNFVSGFYINKSGDKIIGLILEDAAANTPQSFQFKKNDNDQASSITKKNAITVSLDNPSGSRSYTLKQVLTYKSSDNINKLDKQRDVNFEKQELFIESIIESDISLYRLRQSNSPDIFFYSDKENQIITLVYKRYIGLENKIQTNNSYQQQLSTALMCSDGNGLDFSTLNYNEKSLSKIFQSYIACTNANISFIKQENQEKLFNIKALAGIGASSFSTPTVRGLEADFGNANYVTFGIELEYLLNNSRKWGLVLNISNFNFSNISTNEIELNFPATGTFIAENEGIVQGIDLNLGARHYLYLNDNSAFFLGAFVGFDVASETTITFLNTARDEVTTSEGAPNVLFGAGYQWKKISLEAKIATAKNNLREGTLFNNSQFTYSSITLRYSLLDF